MTDPLSEEEMRQDLFGGVGEIEAKVSEAQQALPVSPKPAITRT